MHWGIDNWDELFHRALLVPIAMIFYAGPASAFALDRFLSEELMDESSTSFDQWLPFVLGVWLVATPIILGFRYWDDNPEASAVWLGIFLGVALLPTLVGFVFVYRAASALVIFPALVFPFQWIDADVPSWATAAGVVVAHVVTFTLFFAIPLGALIVQVLQLRGSPRH